jgi:hypothetical protein
VAYKKDIDDLRESPALTIIELLQAQGAAVSYNDPFFATVGKGRKYDLQMTCTPLDNLGQYDCALIVTDHSEYDYKRIVRESQLVVDTRNATKGIKARKSYAARRKLQACGELAVEVPHLLLSRNETYLPLCGKLFRSCACACWYLFFAKIAGC